jgi:hypothetical protein
LTLLSIAACAERAEADFVAQVMVRRSGAVTAIVTARKKKEP